MATTRKRSSGFTNESGSVSEEKQLEEFLDAAAVEMFETLSREEEASTEETQVVKPFVEEIIVPTEDLGPRFLEKEAEPAPAPKPTPAPELKPRPKRHPRNVPRFSRTR